MLIETLRTLDVHELLFITVRGVNVLVMIDKHDIISTARPLYSSTRFLEAPLNNSNVR
jgi:hypothetical protein